MPCGGGYGMKGLVINLAPREGESSTEDQYQHRESRDGMPEKLHGHNNDYDDDDDVVSALNRTQSSSYTTDPRMGTGQKPLSRAHSDSGPQPYEELDTPPDYSGGPPGYTPRFTYDTSDRYRYSLAQRDQWTLNAGADGYDTMESLAAKKNRQGVAADGLASASPHWDNLHAQNPNVLKEPKEVRRYREAKEQAGRKAVAGAGAAGAGGSGRWGGRSGSLGRNGY